MRRNEPIHGQYVCVNFDIGIRHNVLNFTSMMKMKNEWERHFAEWRIYVDATLQWITIIVLVVEHSTWLKLHENSFLTVIRRTFKVHTISQPTKSTWSIWRFSSKDFATYVADRIKYSLRFLLPLRKLKRISIPLYFLLLTFLFVVNFLLSAFLKIWNTHASSFLEILKSLRCDINILSIFRLLPYNWVDYAWRKRLYSRIDICFKQ